MDKLVLFCPSYKKDMCRARRMAESVNRFNTDNIPLFMGVPEKDLNDFKEYFGNIPCIFITDEEILGKTTKVYGEIPFLFSPHLLQQLLKLEFWRMGFCQNYAWLDSDSYFIKPFCVNDFFYDDNTPYLIQHESEELLSFARRMGNKKIVDDFNKMTSKLQQSFGRNSGPRYDFGYPPLIWSRAVLTSLYKDYLKPQKMTVYELLMEYPCEMQLYGEYLLYSNVIPIRPIKPMFKFYHYAEQFFEDQMKGVSEYSLSNEYLGMVIQSNWAKLKEKKKPTLVRLKKFFLNFFRQVNEKNRVLRK